VPPSRLPMKILPRAAKSVVALSAATALLVCPTASTLAQGCVAVRGGGMGTLNHPLSADGVEREGNTWLASVGYRFFKSDRPSRRGSEDKRGGHRQQ